MTNVTHLGRFIGPDGKSFSFDHRAQGYGRGEGVAAVVLKRLDDALRDGDPIRAVIRETGMNQDGKTPTITSPSGEAQEALMRACYERSGLSPKDTTYVEAHGTGTKTGDPIEVAAIGAVFGNVRPSDQPLLIGSVKSNLGHTEAASGLAAIIKVVKAFENGQIPPSVNFERENPVLNLDSWNLKVSTLLLYCLVIVHVHILSWNTNVCRICRFLEVSNPGKAPTVGEPQSITLAMVVVIPT